VALVATGLLAGCSADLVSGGPSEPPVFTLGAEAAWSGGEVTVRSSSFRDLNRLPAIIAAGESLAVTRRDDTTLAVRLPIGPEGPVPLVLRVGGRSRDLGTVNRAGYRSMSFYSPGFDFSMLVQARRNGVPVVLGNGPRGITLFYPTLGRADAVTGLRGPNSYYGIGQSYRGDEFVLRDSTGALGVWELWPTPARRRDWPASGSRQATVLSPTTFLHIFSHGTFTEDTTTPAKLYGPFDTEDCWNVHLSPRGDRTLLRSTASNQGVPVIDNLTGDTAYTIPELTTLAGAAFTADGAEFLAAGYRLRPWLRRVDATTGTILSSAQLPDSAPVKNIAIAADGRFAYVHVTTDCLPRILVYDRVTLALLGDLRVPASVQGLPCDNTSWEGMLVLDNAPDRLFVVWNGEPFPVFQFSVVP